MMATAANRPAVRPRSVRPSVVGFIVPRLAWPWAFHQVILSLWSFSGLGRVGLMPSKKTSDSFKTTTTTATPTSTTTVSVHVRPSVRPSRKNQPDDGGGPAASVASKPGELAA